MPQCQFPIFWCFCVSEKLHRKYSRNWTKQKPNIQKFTKASREPKRRRKGAKRWPHHQGVRSRAWPRRPVVSPTWSTSVTTSNLIQIRSARYVFHRNPRNIVCDIHNVVGSQSHRHYNTVVQIQWSYRPSHITTQYSSGNNVFGPCLHPTGNGDTRRRA
jgi:hypothetical protein